MADGVGNRQRIVGAQAFGAWLEALSAGRRPRFMLRWACSSTSSPLLEELDVLETRLKREPKKQTSLLRKAVASTEQCHCE